MDFAIDLLPIAMLVNATFAMYLRCAKVMRSFEFSSHLHVYHMWTQMCFFEACLRMKQSYSKTDANATFAQICLRTQMDFAIDLLPIAMLVNATFAMYLRCAKVMRSFEFSSHLHVYHMWTQMCFFEACLRMKQIKKQVCSFARLLLLL